MAYGMAKASINMLKIKAHKNIKEYSKMIRIKGLENLYLEIKEYTKEILKIISFMVRVNTSQANLVMLVISAKEEFKGKDSWNIQIINIMKGNSS